MDIGRSFSYVFEDQEWVKKVLIGGVVNLIPIVNFAATGYWLEQTRRVASDQVLPLPEWDNFGGYFKKGLMASVAIFIYMIPLMLISCCMSFAPGLLGLDSSGSSRGMSSSGGGLESVVMIISVCGSCLIFAYLLVFLVFLPAFIIRYATTDQFGVFFQFGPAWQFISSNMGGYLMALLVFAIVSSLASLVGSLACIIGAVFTSFWSSLVGAHLFGSLARGTNPMPTMPSPYPPAL